MKYSKAVAIAVAALSVVSLASAATNPPTDPPANTPPTVTYCTDADEYLLEGACYKLTSLPKHTVKKTVDLNPLPVTGAHANTLECAQGYKVLATKKIQVDGCGCEFGENADGTCNLQTPVPTPKKVECSTRYAYAPDATKPTECFCIAGTIEKDGKCGIVETNAEGCALLNRQFATSACGECQPGFEFIKNPKNTTEVLGNACYKNDAISEADCKAKANETHREPKDGFCLCKEGYNFQSPEDVSSKDQPCKSSAAALIMSSTAVLAFIGSLAYLI